MGDRIVISEDSENVWIRGMKGTIVRFLEEYNHPGSIYQWTYEVKLEDGDKSYIPQWEMELEVDKKKALLDLKRQGLEPSTNGLLMDSDTFIMQNVLIDPDTGYYILNFRPDVAEKVAAYLGLERVDDDNSQYTLYKEDNR